MNNLQAYALCSALRAANQSARITDDERWLERRCATVTLQTQSLDPYIPPAEPTPPPAQAPSRGMPIYPPSPSRRLINEIHARHDALMSKQPRNT